MGTDQSSSDGGAAHQRLYEETRRAIGQSLFDAMRVAGIKEGKPAKLTQEELSERTGVARSTIAKYLAAREDASVSANPDLETLCRIAKVLNVPPAMMLLSRDDWIRLANAALMMLDTVEDEGVRNIVGSLPAASEPFERGEGGLRIAKRVALYSDAAPNVGDERAPLRTELIEQQRTSRERTRLGIMALSALAPLEDMKREYRVCLLSLCALLGASTQL